jgi:hypothetical protein
MNTDTESDAGEGGAGSANAPNNPYGQRGLLKCQRCRDRRKKVPPPDLGEMLTLHQCIYQDVNELCQYCLSNQYTDCQKELGAVQRVRQHVPVTNVTTVSEMAKKLEDANPYAGYDDILETIRQNGEYIKAHGAIQAIANPSGNRQTTVKPSAVATQFEAWYPSESFDQILARVYQGSA